MNLSPDSGRQIPIAAFDFTAAAVFTQGNSDREDWLVEQALFALFEHTSLRFINPETLQYSVLTPYEPNPNSTWSPWITMSSGDTLWNEFLKNYYWEHTIV